MILTRYIVLVLVFLTHAFVAQENKQVIKRLLVPLKPDSCLFETIFGNKFADNDGAEKGAWETSNLIGTWANFYFRSSLMSSDSVMSYLNSLQYSKIKVRSNPRYSLVFTKDSVLNMNGIILKFYFNSKTGGLNTTTVGQKGTRTQQILALTREFLVLEDCCLDCFTMFYIRQ